MPALPPAAAGGAGSARQPGVGRRPGLRARLPRTPLGPAATRRPPPAARARRPDRLAPARPQPPAVGDLLRRGAGRGPGRGARPRATRSWSTAARPSTSVRSCSTPPPTVEPGPRRVAPGAPAGPLGRALGRGHRLHRAAQHGPQDRPGQRRVGGPYRLGRPAPGRVTSPAPWPDGGPIHSSPDQPAALAAAPVRRRPHRARRLQAHPPGPRRHHQRRHPRHPRRCAARLADDPHGVDGRAQDDQGDRADVGDRRRARGRPRSAPRSPATWSTCRSASLAGRPPAPGQLRLPGPQGDRPRGLGPTAGGHRRLRADHLPRPRLAGRGRRAASRLPPLGHQRARAPVPAVRRRRAGWWRPTRSTRCCPTTRWRSASRPTTAASSTASRPTATPSRTSTPSASACSSRSTSSGLASATRPQARGAARRRTAAAEAGGEAHVSVRRYLPTTLAAAWPATGRPTVPERHRPDRWPRTTRRRRSTPR